MVVSQSSENHFGRTKKNVGKHFKLVFKSATLLEKFLDAFMGFLRELLKIPKRLREILTEKYHK